MNITKPKQPTIIEYHNGEFHIIEGIHKLPPDMYERYMQNTEEYLIALENR